MYLKFSLFNGGAGEKHNFYWKQFYIPNLVQLPPCSSNNLASEIKLPQKIRRCYLVCGLLIYLKKKKMNQCFHMTIKEDNPPPFSSEFFFLLLFKREHQSEHLPQQLWIAYFRVSLPKIYMLSFILWFLVRILKCLTISSLHHERYFVDGESETEQSSFLAEPRLLD